MGERKFTLIELHLEGDPQFGPRRIGEALPMLGGDEDVDADDGADTDLEDEADEGGRSPVGIVVALVALVGIALAVRKFRGGDDEQADLEEFETEDEPDVIVDD